MTRKKPEPERRIEQHPGVFPYDTKQGTRYRYQFDVPPGLDGRRKVKTKRGFLTEVDASAAMRTLKTKMRLPGYEEPTDETLADYFTRWMHDTQHGRRASTNQNYARALAFFPETFRATPVRKLTPTQVRRAYAELVQVYAPSSCRFARTVLVMVLKAAHRERLIPANPAEGITLPISRDADADAAFDPKNVWTVPESRQFLAATAEHPHHMLWRFLLDSGLRIGEALALNWDDFFIDDEGPKIRVTKTITKDEHGRGVIGRHPKTQTSRREVSLMSETVAYLDRYRTEQKVRRVGCGPLWQDRNMIFDDGDGAVMPISKAQRALEITVKRIDVPYLSLHGMRHTMAVTWLRAGESPAVVAARLGHKSAAFTLDVYAKVTADWQQSAVTRVEAFIRNEGKPLPPPPDGTLVQFPEQG